MVPAFIFLNGPPRSGKDTLAAHLCRRVLGLKQKSFAEILKNKTHLLYGLPSYTPASAFEGTKDEPNPVFLGLTPRQAYINVSELLFKPAHGDQIFGQFMLNEILRDLGEHEGYVFSDSGFASEALPLLERFGAERCLLVRIVAEKRGCTFVADSRSYIELPVPTVNLTNNSTKEEFFLQAESALRPHLNVLLGGRM